MTTAAYTAEEKVHHIILGCKSRNGGSVQLPPRLGAGTYHDVAVVVADVDVVVMVFLVVNGFAERSLVGRFL